MAKYKEMSLIGKTAFLEMNRNYFVDNFGVPEGEEEEYYKSNEFLDDFFKRNEIGVTYDLEVIK
jgi:hypothetical protein